MKKIYNFFSKIKGSSGVWFITILMCTYFCVSAVKGDRGVIRYINLNEEVSKAREVSEKYAKERAYWDEKVELLSTNLDLDLLDEQVRTVINMVGPNEFVILDEKNQ